MLQLLEVWGTFLELPAYTKNIYWRMKVYIYGNLVKLENLKNVFSYFWQVNLADISCVCFYLCLSEVCAVYYFLLYKRSNIFLGIFWDRNSRLDVSHLFTFLCVIWSVIFVSTIYSHAKFLLPCHISFIMGLKSII